MATYDVVLVTLFFSSFLLVADGNAFARYPAVFNFGDSNSDTGGLAAGIGYPIERFPYGAPSFKRGTNFATGGSTIVANAANTFSPFTFGVQVAQFVRFKARVLELLATGARNFWIHNTGPLGCLATVIAQTTAATTAGNKTKSSDDLDQFGCLASRNRAAAAFNSHLNHLCTNLKSQFPDINLTYVDIYSVKLDLIANYTRYGFKEPIAACCGYGGPPLNFDIRVPCGGATVNISGSAVTANVCDRPSEYVNWDGVHYTDAADRFVAQRLISGEFVMDAMHMPFLRPYLDSVGDPSFNKGINFATAGATILAANANAIFPFSFGIQVAQFARFKAKVLELLATGPLGCLPRVITAATAATAGGGGNKTKSSDDLDQFNCLASRNRAAAAFNTHLNHLCTNLKSQFPDINLTYADVYSVKLDLIANYTRHGFKEPLAACCGYGGPPLNFDSRVPCGATTNTINGTMVTSYPCKDSYEYVNWDGTHYTDAANQFVAQRLISGNF
ncbi:GDSL esterase/lipase At3g05180 [Linum perenne]